MSTPQVQLAAQEEKAARLAYELAAGSVRGEWLVARGHVATLLEQREVLEQFYATEYAAQKAGTGSFRGADAKAWHHAFEQFQYRTGWYYGQLNSAGPDELADDDAKALNIFAENILAPLYYGGEPGVAAEKAERPDTGEGIRLLAWGHAIAARDNDPAPPVAEPGLWEDMSSRSASWLASYTEDVTLEEHVDAALKEGKAEAGSVFGVANGMGSGWGTSLAFLAAALAAGGLLYLVARKS